MSDQPTSRQLEVLRFVRDHFERSGMIPTVREIASHFGFASPLSAQQHLQALEKKGCLERIPGKSRGLRISGQEPGGRSIPLVGRVRAGQPVLALEEAGERLTIDRHLFRSKDAFALRVTGDSMIEAGILDGDLALVKPDREPANGSIAVVRINDEVTLKRFFRMKKAVRLVPANSAMQDQVYPLRDVQVIGRVIGLIRKI